MGNSPAAGVPHHAKEPTRRPFREEFAASPEGRTFLSMVIVLLVAVMVLSNLPPESHLSKVTRPMVRGVTDVTGLHQNWNLFAPSPPVVSTRLRAVLLYSDGTTLSYQPPKGDPFVGTYSTFRWRKYASRVMGKDGKWLQESTADWVARQSVRNGEFPVRVSLLKGRYKAPQPGSGEPAETPAWKEQVIHVANYDPKVGP